LKKPGCRLQLASKLGANPVKLLNPGLRPLHFSTLHALGA
jgi:hypothetical protein